MGVLCRPSPPSSKNFQPVRLQDFEELILEITSVNSPSLKIMNWKITFTFILSVSLLIKASHICLAFQNDERLDITDS